MVSASAGGRAAFSARRVFHAQHNFVQREGSQRLCVQLVRLRAFADHHHLGVRARHPHRGQPVGAGVDAVLFGDSGKDFERVLGEFVQPRVCR